MDTATVDAGVVRVAREKKKPDDKQVTFRLSSELHARLEAAADGLELDLSSLLRTMIREQLTTYENRADEIRAREAARRAEH